MKSAREIVSSVWNIDAWADDHPILIAITQALTQELERSLILVKALEAIIDNNTKDHLVHGFDGIIAAKALEEWRGE